MLSTGLTTTALGLLALAPRLPRLARRYDGAALPVPLAIAATAAGNAPAVRHFGHQLAGYHQLTRRSRVGGILYRVGVQLRPLAWFLRRRPDEPWDDAWLARADEARLDALSRWLPRRPTLIVLDGEAADSAGRVAQALAHAAQHGDQPVRLLVLGKRPADTPSGVPLTPL